MLAVQGLIEDRPTFYLAWAVSVEDFGPHLLIFALAGTPCSCPVEVVSYRFAGGSPVDPLVNHGGVAHRCAGVVSVNP